MTKTLARTVLVLSALVLLVFPAHRSLTNPIVLLHMDLQVAQPGPDSIPGNGSIWHEIRDIYCTSWTQIEYADNDEDGTLSRNDFLRLDDGNFPMLFRVDWIGPDYFLSIVPPGKREPLDLVYNPFGVNCKFPLSDHDPMNPVGEIWTELYPGYCLEIRIDQWFDNNSNGVVDEGDEVLYFPEGSPDSEIYRIERVATAVNLLAPAVGTKTESWTEVKETFSDLEAP